MVRRIYSKGLLIAALLAVLLSATFPRKATALTSATNSEMSDGSGSGWLPFTNGGMHISANTFMGSNSHGLRGDFTSDTYYVNQYSQITITAIQLSNAQWIGPSVRVQNGGSTFYVGMYDFNNGSPYLQILKRAGSNWVPLSGTYDCGKLAAGTKLRLEVVGATVALQVLSG